MTLTRDLIVPVLQIQESTRGYGKSGTFTNVEVTDAELLWILNKFLPVVGETIALKDVQTETWISTQFRVLIVRKRVENSNNFSYALFPSMVLSQNKELFHKVKNTQWFALKETVSKKGEYTIPPPFSDKQYMNVMFTCEYFRLDVKDFFVVKILMLLVRVVFSLCIFLTINFLTQYLSFFGTHM